jgi:hypothetical protein
MIIAGLLDATAWPVRHEAELDANELWSCSSQAIYSTPRFVGAPSFYPVYRKGTLYSHSPLGLIAQDRDLVLDRRVAARIGGGVRRYWSGVDTLDRRIQRVGAPRLSARTLRDPGEFLTRLAAAMTADVATVEARNPGATNAILCGGRDSLNLLLLPWKNPVVVLSAAPNFALVRKFIADNGLTMEVRELVDEDRSLLDSEVLANLCRLDLGHCRWAGELRAFAVEMRGRVVFWKGQLADTFLTPYWRSYTHPPKLRRLMRLPLVRGLTDSALYQGYFAWSLYNRGSMWQGAHMSLLRDLTGALVLSPYHGPTAADVLGEVDLAAAVTSDIRGALGERLAGGPVRYPATNPGPASSRFREGISGVDRLIEVAEAAGLRVRR